MSDLVAVAFEDRGTAEAVMATLGRLQVEHAIEVLADAAAVTARDGGRVGDRAVHVGCGLRGDEDSVDQGGDPWVRRPVLQVDAEVGVLRVEDQDGRGCRMPGGDLGQGGQPG